MSGDLQYPTDSSPEGWRAYWAAQGMPWRTEPAIDAHRQSFVKERRAVLAQVGDGIFPFGAIALTRADVEWLLATHVSQGIVGPVNWEVEKAKEEEARRTGLDLRGADLHGVDLSYLPLASLVAGYTDDDWVYVRSEHYGASSVHLEGASLRQAILTGANLGGAHLEQATLMEAHLEDCDLSHAFLQGADITTPYGAASNFSGAHMERTMLCAGLDNANLSGVHLEGATLFQTSLTSANLTEAHFEGTKFETVDLRGADFSRAWFDSRTELNDVALSGKPPSYGMEDGPRAVPPARFVDVRWGGADLTRINWKPLLRLGNDAVRPHVKSLFSPLVDTESSFRLGVRDSLRHRCQFNQDEYETAERANRQLATRLRDQGMNAYADRFAYRAQICRRDSLLWQLRPLDYLGSLALDAVAGYGYRPMRAILAYAVVIAGFMGLYLLNAQFAAPHLTWDEALVLSISSFHGRGFFSSGISLGDTLARLAAGEAIIGLLIEITFIATFTNRFFAR